MAHDPSPIPSVQEGPQGRLSQYQECPYCQGDGFIVSTSGPGTFSTAQGCWIPTEEIYKCRDCAGTGRDLGDHEPDDTDYTDPEEEGEGWKPSTALSSPRTDQLDEPDLPF